MKTKTSKIPALKIDRRFLKTEATCTLCRVRINVGLVCDTITLITKGEKFSNDYCFSCSCEMKIAFTLGK